MVILNVIIKTNDYNLVDTYFKELHKSIKAKDLIKNAFNGGVKKFDKSLFTLSIVPIYPPVYLVGVMYLVVLLLFFRSASFWFLLPGILISASYFFYSKLYFMIMMFLGLRRKGFNGKITFITSSNMLKRITENGTNRSL